MHYEEALRCLESHDPDNAEVKRLKVACHINLGEVDDKRGDREKACDHLQAAANDAPRRHQMELLREIFTNRTKEFIAVFKSCTFEHEYLVRP